MKRPNYGSGRVMHRDGYVMVWRPGHPLAMAHGYVLEHRLVLHEAGVTIPEGFHVHHINGDKADNRLDNLAVVTNLGHRAIHGAEGETVRNQHGEFVVGEGINAKTRRRREALGARSCETCEADITAMRLDARFCSTTCRNRWHKRKAA